jgi:hypothetical protein
MGGDSDIDATRLSTPGRNHLGVTTATNVSVPSEGGGRYNGPAA